MKKEYYIFGLLAALLLGVFFYETYTFYSHERMHGAMHGTMSPGISWSFWIFLILAAVFIYLVRQEKEEDAFEILKKRYAKGEITRYEYLQICKDLIQK